MKKWLLVAIALLFAGGLAAQNERMRFQGRLMDSGGTAITTATDVTFRMYSTPTGGTALWTEAHSGASAIVPNSNGIFSVELGATTAITGVDFSQPVYLGISVSTDAEMTPRHLFTAAGYAHYAADSASLGGLGANQFAQLGAGTVTFTGNVTANSFTGDGSGLTSIDATQLVGIVPAASLSGSYGINVTGSAGTFTGNLTGDVTSTGMTTTVSTVAGLAAASVTAGASLANNSTATNTASTIVRRDAGGGFTAGPSTFDGGAGLGLTINTTGGQALDVNGSADIAGLLSVGTPAVTPGVLNVGGPIFTTGPLFMGAGTPVTFGYATASQSNLLSTASAARNWSLPDASGTLALTSDFTSGTLAGNFTSINVAGAGTVGGLLSANNGLLSTRTFTGVPTNANGSTFLVSSDAQLTFAGYGEATYTGTTATGFQVMGLHGLVEIPTSTAGVLAIGTGGQATDVQLGDNLGVHAWARQGGRNAGLMAVANADFTQQQTWSASLGTIHSAILGFNNGVGANQYGLYVEGQNNRIVGNLTVTGTITGSFSGDASTLQTATWASPLAIGTSTPSSGAFTTLSTTGNLTVGGTITATQLAGAGPNKYAERVVINGTGAISYTISNSLIASTNTIVLVTFNFQIGGGPTRINRALATGAGQMEVFFDAPLPAGAVASVCYMIVNP